MRWSNPIVSADTTDGPFWAASPPVFLPGPEGTFDEVAVKDPSIVFYEGRWRLFYTACGKGKYSLGYVSAEDLEGLESAPRARLERCRGRGDPYAAAPQVFYFAPQEMWYLVFQTRDSNYQPVFSTSDTIEDPASWTAPQNLVEKTEPEKWIDFWVVCDEKSAYLFYTRAHRDIYVMTTSIEDFPKGFGDVRKVFSHVHEAVHVYKVKNEDEYHLFFETETPEGLRRFGLATASRPLGPWTLKTDDFATGERLRYEEGAERWTDEVSHGEMIRSGYDQGLEYDPERPRFLIQGIKASEHRGPYPDLSWKLGVLVRK